MMETTTTETKESLDRGARQSRGSARAHPRFAATVVVASLAVVGIAVGGADFAAASGAARWLRREETTLRARLLKGPVLAVGDTVEGTIGTSPATSSADKSFVDYSLRIDKAGIYEVALESERPSTFDPFVLIRRNDDVVESSFASAGMQTARAVEPLVPGTYTVRVTTLREGRLPAPARFKLSIIPEHILRDV